MPSEPARANEGTGRRRRLASASEGVFLLADETAFRAVVQHSLDMIVVVDSSGRLSYASPSAEATLGYPSEALLGRNGFELLHPDDRDEAASAFAEVVSGDRVSMPMELRLRRHDGDWVEVEVVASNLLDTPAVGGIVLNIRDISQRVRAERTAREREARHRTVVDSLSDGVLMVGADGQVMAVNARAAELLGNAPRELVAGRIVREDGTPFAAGEWPVWATLETGEPKTGVVMGYMRPTGEQTWLSVCTRALVREDDESPYAVVASFSDITEARRVDEELRQSEARFRTAFESAAMGMALLDPARRFLRVNRTLCDMTGRTEGELLGTDILELAHREDRDGASALIDGALAGSVTVRGSDLRLHHRSGRVIHTTMSGSLVADADGDPLHLVVQMQDVTERTEAVSALAREREFLRVLLDNLDEGILACDADGRLTAVNPALRRIFGIDHDEVVDGRRLAAIDRRLADGSPMRSDELPLYRALHGERVRDVEMVVGLGGGKQRSLVANGQALRGDSGDQLGAMIAFRDVTAQRRYEKELARLALHDPLTGLANRSLLSDRLVQLCSMARRGRIEVAVILLDLDGFKRVNDTLGHEAGDEVLVAVTRRMMAVVRPSDTVARLGGDEFVIACPVAGGQSEIDALVKRLTAAIDEPYGVAGTQVMLTASVGAILAGGSTDDPAVLLRRADEAMYQMKGCSALPGEASPASDRRERRTDEGRATDR